MQEKKLFFLVGLEARQYWILVLEFPEMGQTTKGAKGMSLDAIRVHKQGSCQILSLANDTQYLEGQKMHKHC